MKQLFTNRIYNSLLNITLSYGLMALAQGALAGTGFWLTKTENFGAELASIVVACTLTAGMRRLLYPKIEVQPMKLLSKATLVETVATLFVVVWALLIADYISASQAYSPAGLIHFALLVFVIAITAPVVAFFVQSKGYATARPTPAR